MLQSLLADAKIFFSLIGIALLLGMLDLLGLLNLPKSGIQFITNPIQYGLYKTSTQVGKQFTFIAMSRRAAQEYKAQTEQLGFLLSENAELRRKLAEAQGFLDQKNFLNPVEFNLVASRPIGVSRYLLLDKGSMDGLAVGQVVIYKDNYIGQIIEADAKKSRVLLVSDPDSKIAAFSSNQEGKAKGILTGQFGAEALFDKILHQEPINKDDLVYSEGSETEIPRGLILGQVTEVINHDNQVFKQAKVKPVFTVTDLDIVFVITN